MKRNASMPQEPESVTYLSIYVKNRRAFCQKRFWNELGLIVAERIRSGKVGTTKIENELLKVVKIASSG